MPFLEQKLNFSPATTWNGGLDNLLTCQNDYFHLIS